MATTFTIPLTTLQVGQQAFGPAAPKNNEASVTLTIDRTVAGGLNSLTADSVLGVDVQESLDGGATWQDLGTWAAPGGVYFARGGTVAGTSAGTWNLIGGTSRRVQAVVTVTGPSPIAVAGTIVTA